MTPDFSALSDYGAAVDFFLLRHGKSDGNRKDIIQGRSDYPLSGEGKTQAGLTGRWLKGRGIRAALCSPLVRAAETAAISAAEAGLPRPRPLPELVELDTGVFTDLTLDAAREKYPGMWPLFQRASWEAVEGAENIQSLKARAAAAWNILIREAAAQTRGGGENSAPPPGEAPPRFGILAVTHAGFLQWLIKAVSGGDGWFPLFPMGHCGLYQLSVTGTVLRWELLNFQAAGVTGKR
jgi:broad specificity phosphatase PhoE